MDNQSPKELRHQSAAVAASSGLPDSDIRVGVILAGMNEPLCARDVDFIMAKRAAEAAAAAKG